MEDSEFECVIAEALVLDIRKIVPFDYIIERCNFIISACSMSKSSIDVYICVRNNVIEIDDRTHTRRRPRITKQYQLNDPLALTKVLDTVASITRPKYVKRY